MILCGINNISSSSCIILCHFFHVMLLFHYNLPCLNYVMHILSFDMLIINFVWWIYLISLCGGLNLISLCGGFI